jgi:8-oxo-dGTP pyrophosphatase MutT (NUDIX family)
VEEERDYEIFTVRRERAINPRNGEPLTYSQLRCPDWVNVVALTAGGAIVLIRQFRFGVWEMGLEVPGGVIDEGEAPLEAAARELEEETGYRAAKLTYLGANHPNPAIQNNLCHSFLAEGCVPLHEGQPDAGEDISVILYPKSAVPDLVRAGQITHALVLVALFQAQLQGAIPTGSPPPQG